MLGSFFILSPLARELMMANNDNGAITPRYLREAMRRLRRQPGSLMQNRPHHRLF